MKRARDNIQTNEWACVQIKLLLFFKGHILPTPMFTAVSQSMVLDQQHQGHLEIVRNANSGPHPRLTESDTLGVIQQSVL